MYLLRQASIFHFVPFSCFVFLVGQGYTQWCAGITPGRAWGTLYNARIKLWLEACHLNPCTIFPPIVLYLVRVCDGASWRWLGGHAPSDIEYVLLSHSSISFVFGSCLLYSEIIPDGVGDHTWCYGLKKMDPVGRGVGASLEVLSPVSLLETFISTGPREL